jgi:hypothetical protein
VFFRVQVYHTQPISGKLNQNNLPPPKYQQGLPDSYYISSNRRQFDDGNKTQFNELQDESFPKPPTKEQLKLDEKSFVHAHPPNMNYELVHFPTRDKCIKGTLCAWDIINIGLVNPQFSIN